MATRSDSDYYTFVERPSLSGSWRFWVGAAGYSSQFLVLVTTLVLSFGMLPLYEPIWWWDIAMHSAVSAIIVVWLIRFRATPVVALYFLLGISVGWEVFEAMTPHFFLMAGDLTDTVGDIVSNVFGWVIVATVRWWFASTEQTSGY